MAGQLQLFLFSRQPHSGWRIREKQKIGEWEKNAPNRVKRLAARPKRLRIRAKHGLAHSSLGRKNNRKPKTKTDRAWEKAELKTKTDRAGEKNKHSSIFTLILC